MRRELISLSKVTKTLFVELLNLAVNYRQYHFTAQLQATVSELRVK